MSCAVGSDASIPTPVGDVGRRTNHQSPLTGPPLTPSSSLLIPSNELIGGRREIPPETNLRLFRAPTSVHQDCRAERIYICTRSHGCIAVDDRETDCRQTTAVRVDRCVAASRPGESSKDTHWVTPWRQTTFANRNAAGKEQRLEASV